jgi:hypothetical protein
MLCKNKKQQVKNKPTFVLRAVLRGAPALMSAIALNKQPKRAHQPGQKHFP